MAGNRGDAARFPTVGRPLGAKNKATKFFKAATIEAFDAAGGVPAFTAWAKKNRTEFYKICSRLIPSEVTLAGDANQPIRVMFGGRWKPPDGTE